MQKSTLFTIAASFLFLVFCFSATAQTNVSGGIYANTTWTLANSPYIVVDTVVVFPGVTLTIQPGAVVKFADNMRIEIRQANIIANGTITDSITFTSNSATPTWGIYAGLYLNGISGQPKKFNYCNFRYSSYGIGQATSSQDSVIIKNSNFNYNRSCAINSKMVADSCNFKNTQYIAVTYGSINNCNFFNNGTGIEFGSNITNCNFFNNGTGIKDGAIISNCIIDSNATGIITEGAPVTIQNCFLKFNSVAISCFNTTIINSTIDSNYYDGIFTYAGQDSIVGCQIRYNGIGINDTVSSVGQNYIVQNVIENNKTGLYISSSGNQIYCNKICNNTSYNLYYDVAFGSNGNFQNNYWCSTDSVTIDSLIYDGYDNINLGLVHFQPVDSIGCYLLNGIADNIFETPVFSIYPNPASDNITLNLSKDISKAQLKIYNMLGEMKYSSVISSQQTNIDISGLASGVYLVEVMTENNILRQKFIKQQSSR